MGIIEAELRKLQLETLLIKRDLIKGEISCLSIKQHDIMYVANGCYYVLDVLSETSTFKNLRIENVSALEDRELEQIRKTGVVSNSNMGFPHPFDSSYNIKEVLRVKKVKKRGIISLKRKI